MGMGIITTQHKVASIIHHSPFLLPVLNRFGIRLGVKEKSIEQVCNELNLNLNFVLAIINSYHTKDYFPEKELRSFSASTIVSYLRKTHEYYVNYVLLRIDGLLEELLQSGGDQNNDLRIIKSFYNKYKVELLNHINEEEEHVFPYVLKLQHIVDSGSTETPDEIIGFSITDFEKEHTNVDEKLNDLKNIIIKFLEPTYNDNACNEFLTAIFMFERDLADHSRIEDNIMVPKVLEMEKHLSNAK